MSLGAIALRWIPALLALAALLSTCDPTRLHMSSEAAVGRQMLEVEAALQGTWLREYAADDVQARRVLTLAPEHVFRESVRAVDAKGQVLQQEHAGTWFFDGTNLKRKYTSMDGQPPSRLRVPFATFEVVLESPNAFVGIDHVRGHRVRYLRVEPQTQP